VSKLANILPDAFWFRGTDTVWNFILYQEDGETPQNITGWTLTYVLRDGATNPIALVSKAMGAGGITITSGVNGAGSVTMARADTLRLSPGKYFHRLRRTDSGSNAQEFHGDAYLLQGD
jgi:hypothetical protein